MSGINMHKNIVFHPRFHHNYVKNSAVHPYPNIYISLLCSSSDRTRGVVVLMLAAYVSDPGSIPGEFTFEILYSK